jgi:hypothetical protein
MYSYRAFSGNAGQHFPLKIKQITTIGKQDPMDLMKSYDATCHPELLLPGVSGL